jgi:hypothetical protein
LEKERKRKRFNVAAFQYEEFINLSQKFTYYLPQVGKKVSYVRQSVLNDPSKTIYQLQVKGTQD